MVNLNLKKNKTFRHINKVITETVEQINTGSGRYYQTSSGARYPSITTVVGIMGKKAIMEWRKRVGEAEANRISSKAASRGTRVHAICEDYLNNVDIHSKNYSIIDLESFSRLRPIFDANIDNIHTQETRLYSDYLEIAGTVDCVAEYNGKLSIIDFKTALKPKNKEYITNYFCQASAYAVMYEERTGIPIGQIVIIISVDDEEPQVFVERRDNYIGKLMEVRKQYKDEYGI
jgi:genome maintenance exonuclease 1